MHKTSGDINATGRPFDADDIVAAALADEELMRQVRESLAALRHGDRGTPVKVLQAKHRRASSA